MAAQDGASLNQFIAMAVAEKLAALHTADFFLNRKGKGNQEAFRRLLQREGGQPPQSGDQLPGGGAADR